MRLFRLLFAILVAVFVFQAAVPCLAQNNVDEQQGLKPYDSWHGGDLDTVSLTTGGLALHIPLASFPQRGSLDLSFSVVFSSKQWMVVTNCVTSGDQGQTTTCTRKWEPMPLGGSRPLRSSNVNTLVTGAYPVSSVDTWLQRSGNALNPPLIYAAISPDGNVHNLSNGGLPMRTFDGTGFLQPDIHTLIAPNGTRYYYPSTSAIATQQPATITDANGNQISISASGWSDTLGRLIPGSGGSGGTGGVSPGIATTDLSTCPAGTTAARIWTIPSVAVVSGGSGSRTFKFCYSPFSIFTNFGVFTEYPPTSTTLLSAVVLPDHTTWTISYDNYGSVTRLGFMPRFRSTCPRAQ